MNIQQKTEIASLRSKGFGYTKIAQALGLSKNTVKSYCKRNNLSAAALENSDDMPKLTPSFCMECGKDITQVPGRKEKKFCSDECRHKWWNARPEGCLFLHLRGLRKTVHSIRQQPQEVLQPRLLYL